MQVTLVATAPLTNLALAVQLDPNFPKKLRALYIMGGNTECMCAIWFWVFVQIRREKTQSL